MSIKKYFKEDWPLYLIFLVVFMVIAREWSTGSPKEQDIVSEEKHSDLWIAPNLATDNSTTGEKRKMISYGQQLIANTALYFGPNGSVNKISNGMNCQNCHLNAGTKPFGNNYGAVASTYPKFRERSGRVENIEKRVNDCFERSLNGKAINTAGYEMRSIVTYIKWLGQNVKKGIKPKGSGITDLPYLTTAASPAKGQIVYSQKCQSCHGTNGEGVENLNGLAYTYPPLWGAHSYNEGAGLFRLSRLAGYVRDNMPLNQATHESPVLSDEEAWNVAAFVNSQPRPEADLSKDWPNVSAKPIDHPFGPYTDGFTQAQHKFGPYQLIAAKRKEMKK